MYVFMNESLVFMNEVDEDIIEEGLEEHHE
jgi:hypothetical protein